VSNSNLFETLTNYTLEEFELKLFVVPIIMTNMRSTCEAHILVGRSSKLNFEQCLLNFILYMKHDNMTMSHAFMSKFANCSICNYVIFIMSCINHALINEIH